MYEVCPKSTWPAYISAHQNVRAIEMMQKEELTVFIMKASIPVMLEKSKLKSKPCQVNVDNFFGL